MAEMGYEDFGQGFCEELLEHIKTDDFLKKFYVRLTKECINIKKVVEKYKKDNTVLSDLEKIIGQHESELSPNSKKLDVIGALATEDGDFHIKLFEIGGDEEMVIKLRADMRRPTSPFIRIWQSICRNESYKDKLLKSHKEILTNIESGEPNNAVKAIQKHFAFILPHYSTLFQQ